MLSGLLRLEAKSPKKFENCGESAAAACDVDTTAGGMAGTPGCTDADCCTIVCSVRGGDYAGCCELFWDAICVDIAALYCDPDPDRELRAASVVRTDGGGRVRRLDGVVITGGGERPAPPTGSEPPGGGVFVTSQGLSDDVRLAIVRSRVEDNYAWNGGGIALLGEGPPLIDCSGDGPNAEVLIWNCEIVDNRAVNWGGGVFARFQAPYEIVNSVIARNGHISPGLANPLAVGGALADFTSPIPNVKRRIVNCTITRNFGIAPGIAVNKAVQQVCGCSGSEEETLLCSTWDELVVINTVIRNNLHDDGSGNFIECVDPAPSQCDPDAPNSITLIHCNVLLPLSIPPTWIDCIDVDPGFVKIDPDPAISIFADYRLLPTSAMVDAGTPAGDEPDEILADHLDVNDNGLIGDNLDLDLEIRIVPGISTGCPRVDIGAYEFLATDNCLTGDFNDDCKVDGADLGILLESWGPCPTPCPADLNCDGVVDGADLGILLEAWGASPLSYPRDCCPEPESLPGGGESYTSGLTAAELAELLGFPSVAAMVNWLVEQPFGEMAVYLSFLSS